jgi:aspartate carbamoyltransferase catalytic subunit
MVNPFFSKSIVSIKDFKRSDLEFLFKVANKIENIDDNSRHMLAKNRILGLIFFEPSTRTRLSFEAAMLSIGGQNIGFSEPQTSSIVKGESLTDTIRTIEKYVDLLVLRHPKEGAARFASEICSKPLINAGSGCEEHPTQAMIDLFTILKEKGTIDGLNIALMGDLKYGRTIYSLLYGLKNFKSTLFLISPPSLRVREEAFLEINENIKTSIHNDLNEVIEDIDVLYVTRIQKERFIDPHEYVRLKGTYVINNKILKNAKNGLIIMHPLPKVDEIETEVDSQSCAKYFSQVYNGKILREALLSLILNSNL